MTGARQAPTAYLTAHTGALDNIPLPILEDVLIEVCHDAFLKEWHVQKRYVEDQGDARGYLRSVHSFMKLDSTWSDLRRVSVYFCQVVSSECFSRRLFQLVFGRVTIQLPPTDRLNKNAHPEGICRRRMIRVTDCRPWDVELGAVLKKFCGSWKFAWQLVFELMQRTSRVMDCICSSPKSQSLSRSVSPNSIHSSESSVSGDVAACMDSPPRRKSSQTRATPDETILWINDGKSAFLKFLTATKLMIYAKDQTYIILHTNLTVHSAQKRRSIGLSTKNGDFEWEEALFGPRTAPITRSTLSDLDGMESADQQESGTVDLWHPPSRPYVFEDMVTISSHMDQLHFLSPTSPRTGNQARVADGHGLQFENCRMCFGRFPVCSQVMHEKRMCGCCLSILR